MRNLVLSTIAMFSVCIAGMAKSQSSTNQHAMRKPTSVLKASDSDEVLQKMLEKNYQTAVLECRFWYQPGTGKVNHKAKPDAEFKWDLKKDFEVPKTFTALVKGPEPIYLTLNLDSIDMVESSDGKSAPSPVVSGFFLETIGNNTQNEPMTFNEHHLIRPTKSTLEVTADATSSPIKLATDSECVLNTKLSPQNGLDVANPSATADNRY